MKRIVSLLLWAAALGAPALAAAPAAAPERAAPLVYVIPIHSMIEPALLYVIRRGVAEAEEVRADAIVFSMDTPGGTLDAARDIVGTIQHIRVPTYTFVEKSAYSAGAIIALATRHIYMAPGSVIGDAMPIMMMPWGSVQEMPPDIQEKMVSGTAAFARAAAEQGGHNPLIADAMVRREMVFKIGEAVIKPEGRLLTLTNLEAEKPYGTPPVPLLSEGTVKDLPALLEKIGKPGATVRELRVTGAEHVARFIELFGVLFLIAGGLGIWIEIKTPGFGLPGILGGLCLAIFFWGHHIAGLAGFEDLTIFAVGLALLLIEIFVLPGFGVIGVVGVLLMMMGVMMAMIERYPGGPAIPSLPQFQGPALSLSISILGTIAGAALLGRYLPKTALFRRLVLERAPAPTPLVPPPAATAPVGAPGVAATDLRPAGSAVIGGRRWDVVTSGGFLARGAALRVVEIDGTRIVVEAAEKKV